MFAAVFRSCPGNHRVHTAAEGASVERHGPESVCADQAGAMRGGQVHTLYKVTCAETAASI
eukprot:3146265-Rhodomonas_salina.1